MKKTLSCVLVLALFLALSLTGGRGIPALADAPEDLPGAYEMIGMLLRGVPYPEQQRDTRSAFRLLVNGDGTAALTTPDGVRSFTWDGENFTAEDGLQIPYSFEDGVLVLLEDDFALTFQKMEGVVGRWIAAVNLGSLLETEIPEALKAVAGELALELRSDMSCTLSLESDSVLPSLRQAVKELYSASLEASGSSTEDAEEAYGKSLDEIVASLVASMDLTGLDDSQTGTYMLRDGNIAVRLESGNAPGSWDSSTMSLTLPTYGELRFDHVSGEDTLAKGEGAMSYEAYAAAEPGTPVVIEAYVQACQEWWEDTITVYAQDGAGGYFIYNMDCSEKEAERLIPGQKIRVTGIKSVESGEAEIQEASFAFLKGNYLFPPADVTELLDREELIAYQNQLVSFKGMTIEP
ncbi:MAG: hypothetical protein IKS05_10960, partial [Oscillospiraceae bacterium]|nr:hypothetical protein [Oscillospiraceae bacterium]